MPLGADRQPPRPHRRLGCRTTALALLISNVRSEKARTANRDVVVASAETSKPAHVPKPGHPGPNIAVAMPRAQSDRSFRVHEMVVQARATVHMGVACGVAGAMHGALVRGRFGFGRGRGRWRGTNHEPEHQGIRAVSADGCNTHPWTWPRCSPPQAVPRMRPKNGGGLGHLRPQRRCPALAQARSPS